ncbi:MAG: hypothetical protein AAGG01_02170, partial [Planctomycetota bacterium]
ASTAKSAPARKSPAKAASTKAASAKATGKGSQKAPSKPTAAGSGARSSAKAGAKGGSRAERDDLKKINGIGPSFEKALRKAGIQTFAQLGSLKSAEVQKLADKIDVPIERIKNDGWIEKAKKLATGTRATVKR